MPELRDSRIGDVLGVARLVGPLVPARRQVHVREAVDERLHAERVGVLGLPVKHRRRARRDRRGWPRSRRCPGCRCPGHRPSRRLSVSDPPGRAPGHPGSASPSRPPGRGRIGTNMPTASAPGISAWPSSAAGVPPSRRPPASRSSADRVLATSAAVWSEAPGMSTTPAVIFPSPPFSMVRTPLTPASESWGAISLQLRQRGLPSRMVTEHTSDKLIGRVGIAHGRPPIALTSGDDQYRPRTRQGHRPDGMKQEPKDSATSTN